MSGAQAADLPFQAKAVEYVRICSLYGAGFFYIPGTDTCIKLGGYLRVETALGTNSVYNAAFNGGPAGAENRLTNTLPRGPVKTSTSIRAPLPSSVVRTFFDATFSWTSGSYTGNGAGGAAYSGAAPVGSPSDGGIAGGSLGVYYAFIQFDTPWQNYRSV